MKNIVIWMSVMLLAAACGDASEEVLDEQRSDDPAAALAEATEFADGKGDETVGCGDDTCAPVLCGYDCTATGNQCVRGCAEQERREETFVTFGVSGAHTATLDSTELDYTPVLRLTDALLYGCDLWDFSSQEKDGLEVTFKELIDVSATTSGSSEYGQRAFVYIGRFLGPGIYEAEGYYAPPGGEVEYFAGDACEVTVTSSGDGIRGDVSCGAIPARDGSGSVRLEGSFQCSANSMDPLFNDLTP